MVEKADQKLNNDNIYQFSLQYLSIQFDTKMDKYNNLKGYIYHSNFTVRILLC